MNRDKPHERASCLTDYLTLYRARDFSHLTKEERDKRLSSYWSIFVNSNEVDEDVFACIYTLSIDDLFSYGISLGADEDTCEDAIHDIFCSIYARHGSLGHVSNAMGYMLTSIRNKLVNVHKRYAKETDFDPAEIPFATDVTVMDSLIQDEERNSVQRTVENLLAELTPRQREAVYLRYMQNMDYDEIARLLGMNTDSVRKLVYRALRTMRQQDKHRIPFILVLFILSQRF